MKKITSVANKVATALFVATFTVACGGGGGGGGDEETDNDKASVSENGDGGSEVSDNDKTSVTEGGNGDSQEVPTTVMQTVSGKVIDGYIKNATVCLDLNDNNECDEGEPDGITGEDGSYTIEASSDDLAKHKIVAKIVKGVSVDAERGPIDVDLTLTTTKGQTIITPLTTIVALTQTADQSVEDAELTIKDSLGIDEDVSLYDDFIAATDTQVRDDAYWKSQQVKLLAKAAFDAIKTTLPGAIDEVNETFKEESDELKSKVLQVALKTAVGATIETVKNLKNQFSDDITIARQTAELNSELDVDKFIDTKSKENLEKVSLEAANVDIAKQVNTTANQFIAAQQAKTLTNPLHSLGNELYFLDYSENGQVFTKIILQSDGTVEQTSVCIDKLYESADLEFVNTDDACPSYESNWDDGTYAEGSVSSDGQTYESYETHDLAYYQDGQWNGTNSDSNNAESSATWEALDNGAIRLNSGSSSPSFVVNQYEAANWGSAVKTIDTFSDDEDVESIRWLLKNAQMLSNEVPGKSIYMLQGSSKESSGYLSKDQVTINQPVSISEGSSLISTIIQQRPSLVGDMTFFSIFEENAENVESLWCHRIDLDAEKAYCNDNANGGTKHIDISFLKSDDTTVAYTTTDGKILKLEEANGSLYTHTNRYENELYIAAAEPKDLSDLINVVDVLPESIDYEQHVTIDSIGIFKVGGSLRALFQWDSGEMACEQSESSIVCTSIDASPIDMNSLGTANASSESDDGYETKTVYTFTTNSNSDSSPFLVSQEQTSTWTSVWANPTEECIRWAEEGKDWAWCEEYVYEWVEDSGSDTYLMENEAWASAPTNQSVSSIQDIINSKPDSLPLDEEGYRQLDGVFADWNVYLYQDGETINSLYLEWGREFDLDKLEWVDRSFVKSRECDKADGKIICTTADGSGENIATYYVNADGIPVVSQMYLDDYNKVAAVNISTPTTVSEIIEISAQSAEPVALDIGGYMRAYLQVDEDKDSGIVHIINGKGVIKSFNDENNHFTQKTWKLVELGSSQAIRYKSIWDDGKDDNQNDYKILTAYSNDGSDGVFSGQIWSGTYDFVKPIFTAGQLQAIKTGFGNLQNPPDSSEGDINSGIDNGGTNTDSSGSVDNDSDSNDSDNQQTFEVNTSAFMDPAKLVDKDFYTYVCTGDSGPAQLMKVSISSDTIYFDGTEFGKYSLEDIQGRPFMKDEEGFFAAIDPSKWGIDDPKSVDYYESGAGLIIGFFDDPSSIGEQSSLVNDLEIFSFTKENAVNNNPNGC